MNPPKTIATIRRGHSQQSSNRSFPPRQPFHIPYPVPKYLPTKTPIERKAPLNAHTMVILGARVQVDDEVGHHNCEEKEQDVDVSALMTSHSICCVFYPSPRRLGVLASNPRLWIKRRILELKTANDHDSLVNSIGQGGFMRDLYSTLSSDVTKEVGKNLEANIPYIEVQP